VAATWHRRLQLATLSRTCASTYKGPCSQYWTGSYKKPTCCTSFFCTFASSTSLGFQGLALACSHSPPCTSSPSPSNLRVNLHQDLRTWGYDSILPKRSSPSLRWNLYLMVQRTSLLQAYFWYVPSLIYRLGFDTGNDVHLFSPQFLQEEKIGPFDLPELISGAATWSHFYNEKDKLSTDVPLRTIRLALR
jgi:hypothetical protein